jgi:hypothetical protein
MLVLSATWRTHYLRKLIDPERFQPLLTRTIGFLRKLSAISPTCQLDCSILEKIQRVLFGIPADEKPMYTAKRNSTTLSARRQLENNSSNHPTIHNSRISRSYYGKY